MIWLESRPASGYPGVVDHRHLPRHGSLVLVADPAGVREIVPS